jgi:AraC-like DNA-binding protein
MQFHWTENKQGQRSLKCIISNYHNNLPEQVIQLNWLVVALLTMTLLILPVHAEGEFTLLVDNLQTQSSNRARPIQIFENSDQFTIQLPEELRLSAASRMFRYKLEGVDQFWEIYSEVSSLPSYEHLKAGNYVFKIEKRHANGQYITYRNIRILVPLSSSLLEAAHSTPTILTLIIITLMAFFKSPILGRIKAIKIVAKSELNVVLSRLFNQPLSKSKHQTGSAISVSSSCDETFPKCSVKALRDINFKQKLDDYLESNFAEGITVSAMASELAMDRSAFTRKVKKLTSYSAQQYLLHYRLQKAYEFLPEAQSVGQVSDLTGFNTQNHLSSSFTKKFGIHCRSRMLGETARLA